MERFLEIKGALLTIEELEKYIEKLGSYHILDKKSNIDTYPLNRLNENFKIITDVYNLLNEHIEQGLPIHVAGEWLLDNYYIIEETSKIIKNSLNQKEYVKNPSLAVGNSKGFARAYVLATEIVKHTDAKVDEEVILRVLKSYQNKRAMSMKEIWMLPIYLNLALIENIRYISEKIYISQIQKYKVESIVKTLIEDIPLKEKNTISKKMKIKYRDIFNNSPNSYIEYMSYKLKKIGRKAVPYTAILEEIVKRAGSTVSDIIKKEHFDLSIYRVSMGNSITSIKEINRINFSNIFTKVNSIETFLLKDPTGIYEKMDYKTQEIYRNEILDISNKTNISEIYIASKLLECAQKAKKNEVHERPISLNNNQNNLDTPGNKVEAKEHVNYSEGNEIYLHNNIREYSKNQHVGYYLIGEGKSKLYRALDIRNYKNINQEIRAKVYIMFFYGITTILATMLAIWLCQTIDLKVNTSQYLNVFIIKTFLFLIAFIITFIPISEIVNQITQYSVEKITKKTVIPKMDYSNGVPKENTTFVVIPTILKDAKRVEELVNNLEVYYLANKSENIFFALLGDVSEESKKHMPFDDEVISSGINAVEKLNQKYVKEGFPIFHFLYRERVWNSKQGSYLGWERKRGLLIEFNKYILQNIKLENKEITSVSIQGKSEQHLTFRANTIPVESLPKVKYVITLDVDTDLTLNSGIEIIGAMSHILNRPELSKEENIVVSGYGIMQPRVGIDIESSLKTKFSQIFGGYAGIDAYTNAAYDLYQDCFLEGIFTGKGIYDLEVFNKVLEKQIPENTVLSHDLLEGSYLRCGLLTDIMFLDGYPSQYNSASMRLHRWIRGDWQIIKWIRNRNSPLNLLSRFKIIDNLRRSLIEVTCVLLVFLAVLIQFIYTHIYIINNNQNHKIIVMTLLVTAVLPSLIPLILAIINAMIFKDNKYKRQKVFTPIIGGLKGAIYRCFLNISFLPHRAWYSFDAIRVTLTRVFITKTNMLEWITAADGEKLAGKKIQSYIKQMWMNYVCSILLIGMYILDIQNIKGMKFFQTYELNCICLIIGITWAMGPILAWYVSTQMDSAKKKGNVNVISNNTSKDMNFLSDVAARTWKYFSEFMNEENNFLPPDNFQENRKPQVAQRTSPTNIGLGLLAILSAYDLKYISKEEMIDLIKKTIDTILILQKWNGHLYNWYNTSSLEPLFPRYVSSVDSGNFIGYLMVLKQGLLELKSDIEISEILQSLIKQIDDIISNTNFTILYNVKNNLFSIGYDVEEGKLTDSYYDLLASEARQTSLISIAKKDVPPKHWKALSRTLTSQDGYKGLVSWSGTVFEYLMPNINIKTYPQTILDESSKFMIMSQKKYSKKLNVPWGMTESAFALQDLNLNYQYKAFGIPWLGLRRGLSDDVVVAPYGSTLALNIAPDDVVKNLKKFESQGACSEYGFYESIDYTPIRLKSDEKSHIVKTYMAHHQGLIMLSINNFLNNSILEKRFSNNPEIKACDILLQERMPEKMILTKEKKEKVQALKYQDNKEYSERIFTKTNSKLPNTNVISNGEYLSYINELGEGYSGLGDISINRFKETADKPNGIFVYIKNIKNKKIWTNTLEPNISKPDKYTVTFTQDMNKFVRIDGDIDTTTKTVVSLEENVEIRQISIRNNGIDDVILEVTSFFEPILSNKQADIAHLAFNNLFLSYEYIGSINGILINRRKREKKEKDIYLLNTFFVDDECIGELEYEIDKAKFIGRNNSVYNPIAITESKPLSKTAGVVVDPISSMKRTIKIKSKEVVKLNLIICVANTKDNVIELAEKFNSLDNIERAFNISKARGMIETRYLNLKGKDIALYQRILSFLMIQNPLKRKYKGVMRQNIYGQSGMWKFGISGDLPIILVEIKQANDVDIINELIRAHEYYNSKNILVDLVILNKEKNSYEQYVRDEINSNISAGYASRLINKYGGIYIINENNLTEAEKILLKTSANIIFDASKGETFKQIEDMIDEYIENTKSISKEKNREVIYKEYNNEPIKFPDLKYFNDYGGFSEDGKTYIIKVNKSNKVPAPWSNILANENFGTLITESGGGYTWSENSRLNRLTAWSNNQIEDIPSEIIYIKDQGTNMSWSVAPNPKPDDKDYLITHGFGFSKIEHNNLGINQELTMFVPEKENAKINILKLKNITDENRQLKLYYYIKPVLGEDETKTNGYIDINKDELSNSIYLKNIFKDEFKNKITYISCSEKIQYFTGNKKMFLGTGGLRDPEGIEAVYLDNESGLGEESIVVIQVNIEIEANSEKEISIILGQENNLIDAQNIAYKYSKITNCNKERENIINYWEEKLSRLQVYTPLESTNIMLNGWALYQTIVCRLWGRSGFYQSGGAFGYRDQLQDVLSLIYTNPEMAKNQIIEHAKHQFIEGDVQHWWHKQTEKGVRTRFSDDLLWLPYVVYDYIKGTNNKEILDVVTNYIEGNLLIEGEDEKYEEHFTSKKKGTIFEHCIKAIEKSLVFGENGLPLMGSGDWNDGMNTVGNKGKGESVWLGFFLYDILNKWIEIIEEGEKNNSSLFDENTTTLQNNLEEYKNLNLQELQSKYRKIMEELKYALNTNGWDGRWYKRAFTDSGEVLGTMQNEECRIDNIAQTWATISNGGDNDKKYISMESLENHLIDRENGLIKLLDPAFDKTKIEPGYIKSYIPGVRENGGQYTHAAMWTIIAFAKLGLGEKAGEYFRMVNPIEHTRTRDGVNKYKVEPYVVAADVYTVNNLVGRGGWTWYTGSSSWMYKAGVEYILGLDIQKEILRINPCIPKDWKDYQIIYKYKNSTYNIKVLNPNEKSIGIEKLYLNGQEVSDKRVPLVDNRKVNNIEVIM